MVWFMACWMSFLSFLLCFCSVFFTFIAMMAIILWVLIVCFRHFLYLFFSSWRCFVLLHGMAINFKVIGICSYHLSSVAIVCFLLSRLIHCFVLLLLFFYVISFTFDFKRSKQIFKIVCLLKMWMSLLCLGQP